MVHTDHFWKKFWLVIFGCLFLNVVAVFVLLSIHNPASIASAESVGADYAQSHDPFQPIQPEKRPLFSSAYLYRDSLPPTFEDWSWGVVNDWSSNEQHYGGAYSLKIQFNGQWSGSRLYYTQIDTSAYQSISLAVFPDQQVQDLYIELFDTSGRSMGRQSIGWYAPGGKLTPGVWTVVTIPLSNLIKPSAGGMINGYSIGAEHVGVAYVDEVHFETSATPHALWEEPKAPADEPPATPINLPYQLSLTPEGVAPWRSEFGRFDLANNAVYLGPVVQKTTGSMAYLRGGEAWQNYKVESTLYWGPAESFSILVRFADDANFVSCAFSYFNQMVQIYLVRDGESKSMGRSPLLAGNAFEPWKDTRQGATVEGNVVSCYVNGEKALSATLPDMPAQGTVGFETWTRNTFDQPHKLEALTVTPIR